MNTTYSNFYKNAPLLFSIKDKHKNNLCSLYWNDTQCPKYIYVRLETDTTKIQTVCFKISINIMKNIIITMFNVLEVIIN